MVSVIILPGITVAAMIRGITKMCQEVFNSSVGNLKSNVSLGRRKNWMIVIARAKPEAISN